MSKPIQAYLASVASSFVNAQTQRNNVFQDTVLYVHRPHQTLEEFSRTFCYYLHRAAEEAAHRTTSDKVTVAVARVIAAIPVEFISPLLAPVHADPSKAEKHIKNLLAIGSHVMQLRKHLPINLLLNAWIDDECKPSEYAEALTKIKALEHEAKAKANEAESAEA